MTSYPAGGIVPHYTQGTEFYSHDEAKVLAETYYSIGNDLYQSLLPKLQTQTPSQEDIWRLYPAFVNLSFSCEIILKLFYENDHERYSFEMIPGKSHSLQCSFLLTFSRMLNILAKSLE